MKLSEISVWVMTFSIIGLMLACVEGWQGCPDGSYPVDGICDSGCPAGMVLEKDECVPFTMDVPDEDGDDDTVDADTVDGDSEGELEVEDGGHGPNGIGLNWVSIPGGNFQMGCSENSNWCDENEKPRHSVGLAAFRMMQTEVTYEQVAQFLNEHDNDCDGFKCFNTFSHLVLNDGVYSAEPGFETHPSKATSWIAAKTFYEWAGGRLPSEAEWEYAARGRTTTEYICGVDKECMEAYAWYTANSNYSTQAVAASLPNKFGLYDVFGNVWELTQDCWNDSFDGAPANGVAWEDGDCQKYVLRGGSVENSLNDLRSSNRSYARSVVKNQGFRCARDMP